MTPLLLLVLSASTIGDALEAYTELRYEDASRHAFEVVAKGTNDDDKTRAYGILGRVAAIDGRCAEATKYFTEMLQGDPGAQVESWESPKISPCFADAQRIVASQASVAPTLSPHSNTKTPTGATSTTEAAAARNPSEPPGAPGDVDDEAESSPVLFWAVGASVAAVVVVGTGVAVGLLLRDQACATSTHCLQTR